MDALNAYKQPIMVYLPPRAELRGGSWVVIDPTINPSMMEMYSDPTASGGVLEPEAIVEIKYRSKDVRKTMERLDPVIKELMEEMGKSGVGATDKALLEERLKRREEQLAGVYHQVFTLTFTGNSVFTLTFTANASLFKSQVAVHFAELHDTPARMKEKGCLREVVPWAEARRYFYWRLRRRLLEVS